MRDLLLLSLLPASLLLSSTLHAQGVCETVVIQEVRYSAVQSATIEVVAYVQGSDCISYPSFILYAPNGDTLAIETVDFFCLGFVSPLTHSLSVLEGATVPMEPFDGRLELFTGFGDSLVCSWDLADLVLCPPVGCTQAEIYLTNPGPLVEFTAYWWVTDEFGTWMDQGWFEMDTIARTGFDTLCLPPGNYQLGFSPFSPIDESYVIGITPSYAQGIGTNTALVGMSSLWELSFSWFEACIDGANSIPDHTSQAVKVIVDSDRLRIFREDGGQLGAISLFTPDGRMVRSLVSKATSASITTGDLATGVHLVRIDGPDGRPEVARIFIP